MFGDSITRGYSPLLEKSFKTKHAHIASTFVHAGIGGESSRDGVLRMKQYSGMTLVVLSFGMNDSLFSISEQEYEGNIRQMIEYFELVGTRVILLTLNPIDIAGDDRCVRLNRVIKRLAREYCLRLVDIYRAWGNEFSDFRQGLADAVHPNESGNELYTREIMKVIPRKARIVLWQYNGNPAECNYVCPYCSYDPKTQSGHHFQGTIAAWKDAFLKTFRNQYVIFYFGHGEPMIGKNWPEVVEMIGSEKKWEMRVISNLSQDPGHLIKTEAAKTGRLNVNASFHPTIVDREVFYSKLKQYQDAGINIPVVYTMWPPFFERFLDDLQYFSARGALVHLRRFRGWFKNKLYPEAYSEAERRLIAHYTDRATIKYMLANELTDGELTWAGVDFMIIDNQGNVGYCDDFPTSSFKFGNVFAGNVRLLLTPNPFPGKNVSDGTVDGVACLLRLDYEQLEGNHILHFSRLGGVYHEHDNIIYENRGLDFSDPAIRAEFHFPPRNLVDADYIFKCPTRSMKSKMRDIAHLIS